jgi:hypothetical protein
VDIYQEVVVHTMNPLILRHLGMLAAFVLHPGRKRLGPGLRLMGVASAAWVVGLERLRAAVSRN